MISRCGCCEGIAVATPERVENRPGLPAIAFRAGVHATFLESMIARLPSIAVEPEPGTPPAAPQLADLTTRDPADPTIALLDAWATVGDVLTFYQERIANEGYLRTATERRSIVELARLVGYEPRPGVAASVYLAFTLEDGYDTEIPAGMRVQSLPRPGEQPATFETSEPLRARSSWNRLRPRLSRPQRIAGTSPEALHFSGIATNLAVGDVLLIDDPSVTDDAGRPRPRLLLIKSVTVDAAADRISVTTRPYEAPPPVEGPAPPVPIPVSAHSLPEPPAPDIEPEETALADVVDKLSPPHDPSTAPPRHPTEMHRDLEKSFSGRSDASVQLMTEIDPALAEDLYTAWREAEVTPREDVTVYVMRVTAAAFGYNVPERVIPGQVDGGAAGASTEEWLAAEDEDARRVFLEAVYEAILPGTYAVLVQPGEPIVITTATRVSSGPRKQYGFSTKTTRLDLADPWWAPRILGDPNFITPLRRVVIHAQPERLTLADEPIEDIVKGDDIPLDDLYGGLDAGRWLIVRGEREDLPGVVASELVMLAGVRQEPALDEDHDPIPGDTTHTTLELANRLAHGYVRSTVEIFGNVAHATHGETQDEVLGSGNASIPLQEFTLKRSPLTYVSARAVTGAATTLEVRVNGVVWPEAPSLAFLGPNDRKIVTRTDDEGKVTVVGGNGVRGARFPTGVENVTAVYRIGIGTPGNVDAGQITLLSTRPLGVSRVTNPIQATGGADRETRDEARENAPLSVMALDRLVSVRDYADFARTFAGIGKAAAIRVPAGGQSTVTVVIAGARDAPIDETSDVYRNLLEAFQRYGDPAVKVRVLVRDPVLLILSARVRLAPGYAWRFVEPEIRSALLDAFGFDRRHLGEDAPLSALLAVMHRVPGVLYVDVDAFGGVRGERDEHGRLRLLPEEIEQQVQAIVAAGVVDGPPARVTVEYPFELGYFTPNVPSTLILTEIPE